MISTQYINLNMVPSGVMPVLHCSQYDVGRPLGVVIYNGSESVDLSGYTVTIEGTRTDRTPVTAGVITDGNIGVFTTTPTMTNENDTYRAKVVLTDNAGRVSSLAFVMCVDEKTMDENAEEIEEDASLYQQYTGTVQTIIAQIRGDLAAEITARQNAISAEASARQAADNTLQSNINAEASSRATTDASLQSQINQLVAPSGSAPSAAEVENARIGSDGTVYPTLGDAIRTQNSLLKSQLQASFETVEQSNTHGYFAQPTSVNVLEPTAYSASYTGKSVWDKCNGGDVYKATITATSGLYPYIICDAVGNVLEHGITSQGVTDKIINIPANGAYFGANQYGANDYVQKCAGIPKENQFNLNKVKKTVDFTFDHSYIGTTSPINVDNPTTSSASYAGGFIFDECVEGDIYIVSTDNIASSAYDVLICDATGVIIAHTAVGRSGKNLKNWFVKIPANGKYIGINCYTNSSIVYKYVDITYDLIIKKAENPFSGLKGVAFGTSLTQRADGSGTYGYLTYLRQILDCDIENNGTGGAYWFLVAYDSRSITYTVENYADYSDKDFVILEGCVNDWFTGKGLGTYTDNAYTSVCGCLRKMIEHVYTQKPTAQIYVILDHYGRDDGTNNCASDAVVNGKTQYEYYSELKKVCEYYGIPVICEYAESNMGMFGTQYLVDNIHCNDLGAKQSATFIANAMQRIGIKVKA